MLSAALVAVAPVGWAANEVFDAGGVSDRRPTETQFPFEHVDPLTGNLLLTFTDLVLPGNGGFDLRIQRTYNSKAVYYDWQYNGNTLGEDGWAGVGWTLHMGRLRYVPFADIQGPMEMPDGSQHKFFHHIDGSGRQITRDFWVLDKNANPITVSLPDGMVYEFGGPVIYLPAGSGPDNGYLYVTKIRDPFGNAITINYMTGATRPQDGIASIVQDLRGGQSRTVTFTADSTTRKSVATMTYSSRTWTYTQVSGQLTGASRSLMTKVTPPVGPAWKYTYATTTSSSHEKDEVMSLTTPNGGTISYGFREETFYLGSTVPARSRALWTRTTGGRDVVAGTWTYDYAYGASKDQTLITTPCGTLLYTFYGVGNFTGTVPVWQVGLLDRKDTKAGTSLLESRAVTWQASALISNDAETIGNAQEIGIHVPLANVRTVSRGTRTYKADNDYNSTNFGDYGRPWRTVETGELSRTTTRTFDYAFTPYIRDRIATETVAVGSESFSQSYHYNDSNGFKTSETIYGITRTFSPYLIGGQSSGNVGSITDAENKTIDFTYTWGALKNTITAKYTITRTINSDGTVKNEYRGSTRNQWDYTYDDLMRPLTRKPQSTCGPSGSASCGNTFSTTYDNTAGTWTKTTRGSSWTQANLDGFGRVSSTQTAAGVNTDSDYDACGRQVYASYPYATSNMGTTYEFDDLGRVKKKTNADSTWVGYTYTNGIDVDVRNERGYVTKLDFSAFGDPDETRLVKVTDAHSQAWNYDYNALGSLTSVVPPVGTSRAWVYYSSNLLKQETHPELGTLSESADSIYYTYYANGMLKTRQDPQFNSGGALTWFTYDGNNRLTGIDYPTAYNAFDTTIGYDAFDHRTSASNAFVTSEFGYDNGQRLTSRTDTVDLDGTGPGASRVLTAVFTPDGNDNVARIDHPSGEAVRFTFDADNRVTEAYDAAAPALSYADNVHYHPSGGVTSYVAGNGLTHTTTYDASTYRVKLINAGGKLQLDYRLYDDVGNLIDLKDTGRTGMDQHFAYDELDRATTANGPWGGGGFTYYARGDRHTKTVAGATTTYVYHSAKTTRLVSTTGAEADSFSYDQNGNLLSGFGATFTYAPTNTMTTSTTGGVTTTYRYDEQALRKVKATGSDVRYYAHGPGAVLLAEMCAVGGTGGLHGVRDYVYVGQRLVAELETTPSYTVEFVSASSQVGEGAGGAAPAVRLLTSAATKGPVTVRYRTSDGTAVAGLDYAAVDATVTFPAGSVNNTQLPLPVPVPILNDLWVEPNETFTIQLLEPSCGAKLGATTVHTLTILDDEATVSLTAGASSVSEAAGAAAVTVQVVAANGQPLSNTVTVQYATADGTALAGSDYTAKSGTLTFTPASPGPQVVSVPVTNDGLDEPAQTFTLGLAWVTGGTLGSPWVQAVTILDDDPTAVVSLTDPVVTEGNAGVTNVVFTASLDRGSEWNPSVSFVTAAGTALPGSDYYTTNGTRSFPAGVSVVTINVGVMTDRVAEATESFSVNLSDPVNVVVGPGGTCTVTDDDSAGLSVERSSTREGLPAQVRLRLTPAAAVPVEVDYQTVAGTATEGVDYPATSGTAHFDVGATTVVVPVPTVLDGLAEGVEGFTVELSNAVGAPIGWAVGWVTIVDGELGTDFDGDVRGDLLWRETGTGSGAAKVWLMNGATRLSEASLIPNGTELIWRVAGTGSFQTGGRNDLLWQNESSKQLVVWFMNGTTRAGGAYTTPPGMSDLDYVAVGAGDFDGNGRTDIVWWHRLTGKVQVWLMNGTTQVGGGFTTPDGVVDLNWQVAGTGDFNQDGKPDVLWRNETSGKFVVWLMDGLVRTSGSFLVPELLSDLNWRVVSARDLDGDGKTDVLWRNQLSGRLVVWWMDGIYRSSGQFTSPDGTAEAGWVVAGPR